MDEVNLFKFDLHNFDTIIKLAGKLRLAASRTGKEVLERHGEYFSCR